MSEFDSIKNTLNFMMAIIICIFAFYSIINIMYMISAKTLFFEAIFQFFMLYVYIDFSRTLNDESNMFIEKKHLFLRYRVSRIRYVN